MTKWIVESTSEGKTRKETINSKDGIFKETDTVMDISRKYENYWNQDKYQPRVRVISVVKIADGQTRVIRNNIQRSVVPSQIRKTQQHKPGILNVERPSILGNSSFGFNTQTKSKRPSILNMSMPNILRRR